MRGRGPAVFEARLDFAQMIPASTTVEVELYLERGSRLWLDGDSRHLRLGDRDLMVCQFRDGERLTALACYTRVPLAAVQGGIRLLARLDVDGSGLHTVPKNGDFIERTWALSAHPQLGRISTHEWDNVRANALPPAALPGRDTGEPSGTGNPGERSDR